MGRPKKPGGRGEYEEQGDKTETGSETRRGDVAKSTGVGKKLHLCGLTPDQK